MSPRTLLHYSIVSFAFLGILLANALAWQSPIVGGLLLGVFLFFYGRYLHPHLALGIASLLAIVSIIGTVGYYLFELTPVACLFIVVLIVLSPLLLSYFLPTQTHAPWLPHFSIPPLHSLLPAAILAAAALSLLLHTQILTPVRSPWLAVPAVFFLVIFILALLTVASRSKFLFVTLFFLTISVALFVYPLGYGFDSFIHQATEQHIVDHGTITPKPFYYVGQYALIVISANAFSIPVDMSDVILLPLLATLLLAAACCASNFPFSRGNTKGLLLALFLLPLSTFIVTTPQGLANFWVLLVIITSLRPPSLKLPLLFTLAALVTHPLSGIPAVLFLLIARSVRPDGSCYRSFWPLVGVGAIIMPLVFVANSLVSGVPIAFHPENLLPLPLFEMLHLNFFFQNRFHAWKDLAYLFGWNQTLIVLVFGIIGYRISRHSEELRPLRLFGLMSILMLVNYILLDRFFEFSFLIEYERSNYSERLLQLAQFFALPLVAVTIAHTASRLLTKPLALRAGAVALSAIVLTSVVYMTYPRHDNYEISRGFNVGVSDFAAVEYIHERQESGTYIVLANQAVSAAALKAYGFETYFNGDVFYYPIPTGGPLYELYLEMVGQGPTHERAVKAMDLAGVDTAYFVVNDYWFLADKIIENAKREADGWVAIDNGVTTVFEFQR